MLNCNNLLMSDSLTGVVGFVLGMIIVFLGIVILVVFIDLLGIILKRVNQPKQSVKKELKAEVSEKIITEEEITEEQKVAIVAAISAYYFGNKTNTCEFKVKKIRK